MRLTTAMIYVKDMQRMAEFYGKTPGLQELERTETWVEFAAGNATLALHLIPPHIAEGIDVSSAREQTPIKLLFTVGDVAAECDRLRSMGVIAIERPWGGYDGVDPEGNIFGLLK